MLGRVLLCLPALSFPSVGVSFSCVSGLTPPAITDGSEIPALAHPLPYMFHLVAACYSVPVSLSSLTIGMRCIISRAFLKQVSCTLCSQLLQFQQ